MILMYEQRIAMAVENYLFHWGEMVAFMDVHEGDEAPTKEEIAQFRQLAARVEREKRLLIRLLT